MVSHYSGRNKELFEMRLFDSLLNLLNLLDKLNLEENAGIEWPSNIFDEGDKFVARFIDQLFKEKYNGKIPDVNT